MTHSEFNQILNSLSGLSPEQMLRLRNELESKMAAAKRPAAAGGTESLVAINDDENRVQQPLASKQELSPQEVQQRLLNAGIIRDIKPPISEPEQYRRRKAVPIRGEPLSETVIRERR